MLNHNQKCKREKKIAKKRKDSDRRNQMIRHLKNYKSSIKRIIEMNKATEELNEMIRKNKEEKDAIKNGNKESK